MVEIKSAKASINVTSCILSESGKRVHDGSSRLVAGE
jgi:hypothetical protein